MNEKHGLLPVKSDFVFKLIFGDQRNVDILAEFLKSVLDIPDEEYDKLTIVDPYIKKESKKDKYGILDVKVHTKKGIVIHVEIQVEPIPDMVERTIYSQAKMITEQMSSGDKWAVINRVVTIVITDYTFISENDGKYHHQFRWRTEDGLEFTRINEINTLELNKLPPSSDDSELWYWMKFIKSNDEEVLDVIAERNPQIKRAVGVLKELSADERTRMLFEERERARRDMVSRLDGASNDRAIMIAHKLLKRERPIEEIVEDTGLTREEIEALR